MVTEGRRRRERGLAAARWLLGAVFVFGGVTKLRDPQFFAFAIKAFKLGLGDGVIAWLAHFIPWLELLGGALLLAGLGARPAAAVIAGLMIAFIGGIISLQVRGLDVDCPCFGALEVMCSGPLGACHIARNAILGALSVFVVIGGGGALQLSGRIAAVRGAGNTLPPSRAKRPDRDSA